MKTISWENLRKAEIKAEKLNVPIRKALLPKGKGLEIIDKSYFAKNVIQRKCNSHKGSNGRLLIVAGCNKFIGATLFSTLCALRSGIGLVEVFSTQTVVNTVAKNASEAIFNPCPENDNGYILATEKILQNLETAVKKADAVLFGCGLGVCEDTEKLLKTVIKTADCPIIIDADGINLVLPCIELLREARTDIILTPHPAELARLVGASVPEVLENRFEYTKKLSTEFGVTVMAKSAATLVVSGEEALVTVCGNDGLAKGGSGDMLAGLTASFTAQGKAPFEACTLASVTLGIACEKATKRYSRTCVKASDIIECLPSLFKKFERA